MAPVRWVSWWAIAVAAVVAIGCGDDGDGDLCYVRDDVSAADLCELLGDACQSGPGALPSLSEMVQVMPGDGMPEGVEAQTSHNNLDVIWFENRLFFAFRASRTHFASRDTVMYIVSTTDQKTWTLELKFANEWDLREPRFLAFDGRLFFYFAVLGENPLAFEPQYTMMSEYQGPCGWSEPEQILEPEFIPWRAKTIDGVPYLSGYTGGENIYDDQGEPVRVFWYTTDDGRNFEPVVPGKPVVLEGGVSETDFVLTDDGGLVAVARNELGDEDGWGSKICRAEPGDLGNWTCASDLKKYDSPLLFRHGQDIYLIGRRNVSETGNYDLGRRDLDPAAQTMYYETQYWQLPKRCSLWKVDPDALAVSYVLDLPSAGDTCFASQVPLGDDQFLIYNYTSPVDEPDISWRDGQLGLTLIYRTTLTFAP